MSPPAVPETGHVLPTPRDLVAGARFLGGLPGFLRRRLEPGAAARILRERLARREEEFLAQLRAVLDHPPSPYRLLFRHAGCTVEDVARLVRSDGVEGALAALLRDGIYLLVDEYKGRRPVRRGSLEFWMGPADLHNPRCRLHVPAGSSGSRGGGTSFLMDFGFVADCAVNCLLMLEARGPRKWRKADWEVPGGGALFRLLKFSRFGGPPVRWFSQLDPAAPGLHARYRWSARALRWGGRAAGVPLPRVEHVPLDDPLPIARWMREEVAGGGTPVLFTFPSSAVMLCLAAERAGVSLQGASMLISGEPITRARLDVIGRAGAEVLTRYGTIECGPIGYGCLHPEVGDDLHLNHDLHAIVQAGAGAPRPGVPADALFVTALRPTAPFVFINASMGDRATLTGRECGCPMERAGWRRHIHSIHSFEKLTGAGMTFMDTDIVRILEEVLPARFGGAPTDYQVLEEEGDAGRPVLRLLVHPALGPVDERAVADLFLSALSAGSGVERVMGMAWRDAAILRVERRAPLSTPSGKILHLIARR